MAKTKTNRAKFDIAATSEVERQPAKIVESLQQKVEDVTIPCKIMSADYSPDGYCRERVWIRTLTQEQSRALRSLTSALRESNERYKSVSSRTQEGFVVDRECDALRWLLDRIADEVSG